MAGGGEGSSNLKLYGFWASPYVIRVQWALKLKGIEDYEYLEEDLLGQKSPQLLQYNPVYKKVPVLVHNGKPISESLIIIEYIDETWKHHRPLLPQDPYERAQARFWTKFAEEKCVPALGNVIFAAGKEKSEEAAAETRANLKLLEKGLDRRRFFGGDDIGFADIAIGWIGVWAKIAEEITGLSLVNEKEVPLLSAFFTNFLQIPLIKGFLPPHDKLLEHCRAFHQRDAVKPN